MWIAGVDGCPAGWIAVLAHRDRPSEPVVRIVGHIADLVDAPERPAVIAVDMPMGLPDRIHGSGRSPEQLIRGLLGARQSSVFAIPSRRAVEAREYRVACALALETSDPPRKVSKQGFHLFPKIREIDILLRQRPELAGRLWEVHPELAFWAMNGDRALTEPKKVKGTPYPPGLTLRRDLLVKAGLPPDLVAARQPRGAAADDLLDALAGLAVALDIARGGGRCFPDPPERDAHGLPVAIWTLSSQAPMSESAALPITRTAIEQAHARIAPHVRRTPVWSLPGAFGHQGPVSLKLEFLQHAGSFKSRGAFNTLLSKPIPAAGVAAASGGNHGAAVAYAARQLGLKARIFVPEISSPAKVAVIRSHGADVVIGGARYADAQAACDAYVAQTGALRVHPFDADTTMAGQGTVGLEWEQDGPPLDTVLVAVGGGGLISGIASWWAGRVKVVGVEPEGSRALHAALEAGRPVDVDVDSVAADSLGARNTGNLVYSICSRAVDHVALVTDAAIRDAQGLLWRDWRLATEPGGAAALAALVSGAYKPQPGERIGVLLCGANVELTKLDAVVQPVA
ncbi:serine/threonine dehydratase [Microvirga rosea]|uniref:serine/threonine dehydratase n=1 Tax=Microvirga rosea TaxID=2715425 RepID=UPI0029CAAFD3|nr:serine/threonine dehydratase [Microvirga rosea]